MFRTLREKDPVHFSEHDTMGRFWSLTKAEDIKRVSKDWKNFTSVHGFTLGLPMGVVEKQENIVTPFIEQDPPIHTDRRKDAQGSFSNLVNLEIEVRERTANVLDSLPEEFDWVEKVSKELSLAMLASLFDIPYEERNKLGRWSDCALRIEPQSEEERLLELIQCYMYFDELREARKGGKGTDLISSLSNGKTTGNDEPLEFLGNIIMFLVAGNDTTKNAMTGSVYALHKFPQPIILPDMVHEIIRWQSPIAYNRRTANTDCEIGGKFIQKGDAILMWYASANRDIENGDVVDFNREKRPHLSFGIGTHHCIGSRLAEMQLRVLWEEIEKRRMSFQVLEEPERISSSLINGYKKLRVSCKREETL